MRKGTHFIAKRDDVQENWQISGLIWDGQGFHDHVHWSHAHTVLVLWLQNQAKGSLKKNLMMNKQKSTLIGGTIKICENIKTCERYIFTGSFRAWPSHWWFLSFTWISVYKISGGKKSWGYWWRTKALW